MKSIKKSTVLLFAVFLLIPLVLFKTEADAANNTLPFYNNGAVELFAPNLPEGSSTVYGRADDTIGINPILGQMRYPTMYDGRIGGSSYAPGLNSSFYEPWVGVVNRAHQGQPYYHLVPVPGRNSARNVIEVSKVTDSIMKNVYNGNPEFMRESLGKHEIENANTGELYGEFYYIVEIAHYAGGVADNAAASDSFNGVNPTWLRFVRTSWPDISEFKASSNTVEKGDSVDFSFSGYEYVSESRNAVTATLTITKGGEEVSKQELKFNSNKSEKNPEKAAEEHAGKFDQKNVSSWTPAECGVYNVNLKVEDSVKRYKELDISVTVQGECDEEPSEPSPAGTCSLDINVGPSGEFTSTEDQKTADPNGEIIESHESSQFDVLGYGIPTKEYLNVWGQSEKYLTDYQYINNTGNINYTVNVKKEYVLKWKTRESYDCSYIDDDGEVVEDTCYYDEPHEQTVNKDMDFQDNYSVGYWQIGHLFVYYFDNAVFKNYALPNGQVIVPNSDIATATSNHSKIFEDHVFLKDCNNVDLGSMTINGGYSKPSVPDESGVFEKAAELTSRTPDVKNDRVEVESYVSMDDVLVPGVPGVTHVEGPPPTHVPLAPQIPVEQSSLYIDDQKVNMWETPSAVTSNYELVEAAKVEP